MRRTRTLTLTVLALCALWGLAQVGWAGQQPAPAGHPSGRPRGFAENVEGRLKWMSVNLNLTEEQKAKLRPLLEDEVKQMNAVREDMSLVPRERRTKIHDIRQATRKQIDDILTPEQRAKRAEMQAKARERRAARRGPPANE